MTLDDIYAFIAAQRLGVVSSVHAHGGPEAALVGVAPAANRDIVFDTLSTSRKAVNLSARPACAIVIGWAGEITVQIEGQARFPAGADLTAMQEAYFAVWPDGRSRLAWKNLVHIAVRPRWLKYSDFAAGVFEEFAF